MKKMVNPTQPLSRGAILGGVLGATLWMPLTACFSQWPVGGLVFSVLASIPMVLAGIKSFSLPPERARLALWTAAFISFAGFIGGAWVLGLKVRMGVPDGGMASPLGLAWMLPFISLFIFITWFRGLRINHSR